MTEPMQVLYTYAQEHIVHALLERESDYKDAELHAEKEEGKLRAMLLPSAPEHLDNLLDEQHLLDFYREQSMFRAGFSLAVELMREQEGFLLSK